MPRDLSEGLRRGPFDPMRQGRLTRQLARQTYDGSSAQYTRAPESSTKCSRSCGRLIRCSANMRISISISQRVRSSRELGAPSRTVSRKAARARIRIESRVGRGEAVSPMSNGIFVRDLPPSYCEEALTLLWRYVALLHQRRAARKRAKRWAARHRPAPQPTRPFAVGSSPYEEARASIPTGLQRRYGRCAAVASAGCSRSDAAGRQVSCA